MAPKSNREARCDEPRRTRGYGTIPRRRRQGDPGRGRKRTDHRETVQGDRSPVHGGEPAVGPGPPLHDPGRFGVHQRREHLRRKDTPAHRGRDAVHGGALPPGVPGIVFLSGGQTPRQATEHLNAMNAMGKHPWELSFSYGRALQDPVLKAWKGAQANVAAAKHAFLLRARLNGAARRGNYSPSMEASA